VTSDPTRSKTLHGLIVHAVTDNSHDGLFGVDLLRAPHPIMAPSTRPPNGASVHSAALWIRSRPTTSSGVLPYVGWL
jgi:hypothetical protein